jgi:bisphosphoglycerate-dependent phosphoglycerate mutase
LIPCFKQNILDQKTILWGLQQLSTHNQSYFIYAPTERERAREQEREAETDRERAREQERERQREKRKNIILKTNPYFFGKYVYTLKDKGSK